MVNAWVVSINIFVRRILNERHKKAYGLLKTQIAKSVIFKFGVSEVTLGIV